MNDQTPADRLREKAKRIRDRESLAWNKRPLENAVLLDLLADAWEWVDRQGCTCDHASGVGPLCDSCSLLARIEEIA